MASRKAAVRQDRATRTWTATRPGYGFSADEVHRGFPSQTAALDWLQTAGQLSTTGTSTTATEVSYQVYDGVSAIPMWTPTKSQP